MPYSKYNKYKMSSDSQNIKHKNWMRLAIKEAEKAYSAKEVPIGAIIVKDNIIIGKGYNQCEGLQDPTAHAEILAITSAANSLKSMRLIDCYMYVTKEPCPMCAGALINAKIKFIGFGSYDEKEGCCGSLYQICRDPRFKHQLIVKGGIFEPYCTDLIKEFFRNKRRN